MSEENNDSLCRRIVESSPDAIVFSDQDGVIRLWNAGAEMLFGYSAEEAVGELLDIIVPEKMRERHWEGYFRVMRTGITKYGKDLLAVPGIRKDGSRVSLEFSVALIRDEDGVLLGISAVLRDVTARWQKEKEMKERIAALEAQAKGTGSPPLRPWAPGGGTPTFPGREDEKREQDQEQGGKR
jgi:PAS domain S-box-containing protein